jgi:hypothetical protein
MRATQKCLKTLDKRFSLVDSERRFRRACEQIVLLNHKLEDLQRRYARAKSENRKSFRYSLRLRLAVVEGLRNTFMTMHTGRQTMLLNFAKSCLENACWSTRKLSRIRSRYSEYGYLLGASKRSFLGPPIFSKECSNNNKLHSV